MKILFSREIDVAFAISKNTQDPDNLVPNNFQVSEEKRRTVMKNCVSQGALIAAYIWLLVMVPVTCLAFGGKVSYPNGSPAAGAQVSLIIDDTTKNVNIANPNPVTTPQATMAPSVLSGNANVPNVNSMGPLQGSPVTYAKRITTIMSDAAGHFSFPNQAIFNAMIQIKAPDGKDFATANLPAKMFAKGELTIVLQPQK